MAWEYAVLLVSAHAPLTAEMASPEEMVERFQAACNEKSVDGWRLVSSEEVHSRVEVGWYLFFERERR